MMIKPSSSKVCFQFPKPLLKIHGKTTNRIPTNPSPKIEHNAMINVFSFIKQANHIYFFLCSVKEQIVTGLFPECKG